MASILDYFPRAYVINLPERTDRRKEVTEALEAAGLPLAPGRMELFPAVRPPDPGGFPSISVRGCFMSHLGICRQALKERLPRILILEDDVDFSPRLAGCTPGLISALSSRNWDFFYLGHTVQGVAQDGPVAVHPGSIVATHAYAVNGPALEALVGYLEAVLLRPAGHPEGGPMHLDGAYNMFRQKNPQLVTLLSSPSMAHQRPSRSDISPHFADRVPVLRHVMGALRRLKRAVAGKPG